MPAYFTSRVRVKRLLGIPAGITRHDTYIDDLLDVVDVEMAGMMGIPDGSITQSTYNESFDITDSTTNKLMLRHWPVASVAAVTNDGSAVAASDRYLKDRIGMIGLTDENSFFTRGNQKVSVTYTAGFDPANVPADLAHAASVLAAAHFNSSRHAGLSEERTGGYAYFRREGLPAEVKRVVGRWSRLFVR